MNPKTLAIILLVTSVLVVESCYHEGNDGTLGRGEHCHGVEATGERRIVTNKKGDHLFNNVAKALQDLIVNVFIKTPLVGYCTLNAKQEIIITDKLDKGKEISNQFPAMVADYKTYKTDVLLTTDRDKLTVYGEKHQGAGDENSKQWGKYKDELTKLAVSFVDKYIKSKIQGQQLESEDPLALQRKLQKKVVQIINGQGYVDLDAKKNFINEINTSMKGKKKTELQDLVRQVEDRSKTTLMDLPDKAIQWAEEAVKFIKNKWNSGNK